MIAVSQNLHSSSHLVLHWRDLFCKGILFLPEQPLLQTAQALEICITRRLSSSSSKAKQHSQALLTGGAAAALGKVEFTRHTDDTHFVLLTSEKVRER